ncbi:TetR/AcrR family transcriptional regulator (plasmid) [Embleya sp. NBC_00888]|uniref:TetR/AcrR family transcriptional regulator n=1 Tax=Embleya sp. NBC_00888 TaxID=2975960 RepID=UPI002F915F82|nr:TetR/AcrR family transcriptional regulator [Embleya sp. NBC_00888]
MSPSPRIDLPMAEQPPPERADAARNRRRILDAAGRIVAERGPDALTMNAVAHATGMGVGTVYRRFGDVASLLFALLDEREQVFQAAFLSGPPPLGPGAPAADRLRAFLHALVDRVVEQHAMLLAAEIADPCVRYTSAPYRAMRIHTAMLIGRLRPDADATTVADFVLGPCGPSLLHHLRTDRGLTPTEIKRALDQTLELYGLDARLD